MTRVPFNIDPMLVWGYWLRIEPTSNGTRVVDEEGRAWKSTRAAFWCGRLNLPLHEGTDTSGAMELLHAYLASSVVNRHERDLERTKELFANDRVLAHSYRAFLTGLGLVASVDDARSAGDLTAEGVSALRMLDATRPTGVRHVRPSRHSIDLLLDLASSPITDEAQLARLEGIASGWEHHFARRRIGTSSAVILLVT